MGEQNTGTAAVYLDGKPLGAIGELELSEPGPGVTAEQAAEACQALSRAWGAADRRSGPAGGRFLQMDPQGGGGGGGTARNGNGAALGVG